jgi:hypothetical protein
LRCNPGQIRQAPALALHVWQKRCEEQWNLLWKGAFFLDRGREQLERRTWSRLPLPIPLFVRSRDGKGKDFLEFATALNVSAGGALLAVHVPLRPNSMVSLEIPSAPLPASVRIPKNLRNLRARVVRVTHADEYHLVGVKFTHTLLGSEPRSFTEKRKVASLV